MMNDPTLPAVTPSEQHTKTNGIIEQNLIKLNRNPELNLEPFTFE